jgi:CheY-like chemotaxis protein
MQRVLIVDDEATLAETLAEILAWEGYEVELAENGVEGLAAIERSRPDAVVLDYMMPIMDGLQMLERMRAVPAYLEVPVILMSAARIVVQMAPPCVAFLRKPFDAKRFLETLKAAIAAGPAAAT